jgi:hypothetical protein
MSSAVTVPNCIGSAVCFSRPLGADESQIEALFCAAINTAKQQKAVSLEKRAEATYAEYRRRKASEPGGRGIRMPVW